MTPSPETCKRLTLYLGEKWHSIKKKEVCGCHYQCTCGAAFIYRDVADIHAIDTNRTFTTPADLFAVYSKIVERGEWKLFFNSELWKWINANSNYSFAEFAAWLFCLNAPDQIGEMMEMASAWLKEKR